MTTRLNKEAVEEFKNCYIAHGNAVMHVSDDGVIKNIPITSDEFIAVMEIMGERDDES
tara:strand:- start:238 stop:411 length:174 start_codon:yes stop_codon:yes gene_type:complete